MTTDPAQRPANSSSRGWFWLFPSAVLLLMLITVVLPSIQLTRSIRSNCSNNLKQFGIALATYHDEFKQFPPAYFADADGKPMHSWRIILLPYFEDVSLKALYRQYRFDEPWNSPHNRTLAEKMPPVYRCAASNGPKGEANYLAVVRKETAWPDAESLTIRQIRDGIANTIALVEVGHSGINWLDPRDLFLDQSIQSVKSFHPDGANHLFFDGSVHFLRSDLDREVYRGLLTANGGEAVTIPE